MTIIEKIRDSFKEGLEGDESLSKTKELELYEIAGAELDSDERDAGVWAKAIAKGNGNPEGKYIEYRFQVLKAEVIREREYLRKKRKEEEAVRVEVEKERLEAEKERLKARLKAEEEELKKQREKEALRQIGLVIIGMIVFAAFIYFMK